VNNRSMQKRKGRRGNPGDPSSMVSDTEVSLPERLGATEVHFPGKMRPKFWPQPRASRWSLTDLIAEP
jgi:hypothetical protein